VKTYLPEWKKRKDDVLPEKDRESFNREYEEFTNEMYVRLNNFHQRTGLMVAVFEPVF